MAQAIRLFLALTVTLPLTAQIRTAVFDPSSLTVISRIATAPDGDLIIAGTTTNPHLPVVNAYQSRFASSGLKFTRDGGRNWTSRQLPETGSFQIVPDPTNPSIAYLFGQAGLFRSDDTGQTWRKISSIVLTSLAIRPRVPATLYALINSAVARSTNSGQNWTVLATNRSFDSIYLDPVAPETIYAIRFFDGGFRSPDGGLTWSPIGLPGISVDLTIQFDPNTPGLIFARRRLGDDPTQSEWWRSRDGSLTWTRLSIGTRPDLIVDTFHPGVLYFGGPQTIDQSSDGGDTWSTLTFRTGGPLQVIQGTAPTLAGATMSSYDGGATWAYSFPSSASLTCVPATSGTAYSLGYASPDVFVARLSPSGRETRFSTYFGGIGSESLSRLMIDSTGDIYIAGHSDSEDLPTTPAAAVAAASAADFVAKFSSDGRLLWSTRVPVYMTDATLASGQVLLLSARQISRLSLDGSRTDVVADLPSGDSTADSFAIAPDGRVAVLGRTATDRFGYGTLLVTWLSPSGVVLARTTLPTAIGRGQFIGIDSRGDAVLLGSTASNTFPVTAGTLSQTASNSGCPGFVYKQYFGSQPTPATFITRVSQSGEIRSSTLLGGPCATAVGAVLASNDELDFAGFTSTPEFPVVDSLAMPPDPGTANLGFVTGLSPDASTLRFSTFTGSIPTALAVIAPGQMVLAAGNVLQFITLPPPGAIRATRIGNAFHQHPSSIAPGEIVFLDVAGLDGVAPVDLGLVGPPVAELSGIRVYFDDTQAELMSVSPGRIYCRVPENTAPDAWVAVRVQFGDRASFPVQAYSAYVDPGLLSLDGTGTGRAHALNEDGSLNTPATPARASSRLRLYATGIHPPWISLTIAGVAVPVVSASPVPGFFPGLYEVVVQLGNTPGEVVLSLPASAQQLTIYVR